MIISVLLLRQPLSQLIPALQSLKVAGAEATFYEGLRQAERVANAAKAPEPPAIQAEGTATSPSQTAEGRAEVTENTEQPTSIPDVAVVADSIRETACKAPALAVASASSWINQEMRDALGIEDMSSKLPNNELAHVLRSRKRISSDTLSQILGLNLARSALVGSLFDPLTVEGALRFVDSTERVVIAIRQGL